MKTLRHLSLLIIFCCAFTSSRAQWVTIPDTAFASYLRTNFATCMNGNQMDTTCARIKRPTSVSVINKGIKDLYGIQFFDSLSYFYSSDNPVTYLPPIPKTVTTLIVTAGQLTSLPTLPPGLTFLCVDYNQLRTLPALPASLTYLNCGKNILDSLPVLPTLLSTLLCDENQLYNLPSLPDSLVSLHCSTNHLSALPALPPILKTIDIWGNTMSALPAIPVSLISLYMDRNRFTILPILPPALVNLHCSGNMLTSLPVLPATLQRLSCYNNLLSNLPPLPPNLTNLQCHSNNLTSLPTLPPSLNYLLCYNNNLTYLPTLPDSLSALYCDRNPPLHCLPRLTHIGVLRFDSANITCLPNYGVVWQSTPTLSSKPLCTAGNANGCQTYYNLSGKVYNDGNGNCIQGSGETNVPYLKVNLEQGGNLVQQTYTAGYGFYSFENDTGSYTLSIDTAGLPFTLTCPVNGIQTANVTPLSLQQVYDFALKCTPGFDIAAQSVSSNNVFRPASFDTIKIKAGDAARFYRQTCNTTNLSGSLVITIGGALKYIAPATGALTPTTVLGNTITYVINNWAAINPDSAFNIITQTDTTAQAGTSACFTLTATPTAGDNDTSNNNYSFCFPIENSYDPNNKQVFPDDVINNSAQWLTYTIHFQNTGTAPAININILDTLDAALDASSFELLAYSHVPVVNIYNAERRARFTFPTINLADSVNNEPESHGYIQYRVKTIAGLNCGTQIGNAAQIYFDFNPPITTNAALNRIYMSSTTNLQNTICNGEQFNFNGQALTAPGSYTDTLQAAFTCDSIITLQLQVLPAITQNQSGTTCAGEPFNFNGRALTAAGVYTDTLQASSTCDSIITLQLQVLPAITENQSGTTCAGEPFNFNGRALTAAGVYTDTLQASSSCDSIITLQLQVLQGAEVTEGASICDGETYTWRNRSLTARDTYTDTLQTTTGCDSVLILNLEVYTGYSAVVDTAILSGTSLVLPSGTTVTAPGNYTDTLQSIFGCDSIITTRLSVISGIENIAGNATMQLYPNPANDVVMINLSDNLTGGTLTLSDVTGRSLNTIQLTANHNQSPHPVDGVDISRFDFTNQNGTGSLHVVEKERNKYILYTGALSSGVYLITAVKGGVRVVQRVVVSR